MRSNSRRGNVIVVSDTVTLYNYAMSAKYGVAALAEQVNDWCRQHRVQPLHNGAGPSVTVRNVRYYQTLGLVDRPVSAGGKGFTEKHRLQLIAIRLFQAKGLPLGKIKRLLYRRNEEELRDIERHGVDEAKLSRDPLPPGPIDWKISAVSEDVLLLTRSGRELTPAQQIQILEIINPEPTEIAQSASLGMESFRPESD